MNTPPATVASIIQPLCRKKAARCVASLMGVISSFAANIRLSTPKRRFGSRKRPQKAQQQCTGAFERSQRNPFVGGMGLGNVARTEDDAGNPTLRQHRGIAIIIDTHESALS